MSIWDKMYKWWEQGVRAPAVAAPVAAEGLKEWRVIQLNGPDVIVRADKMERIGARIVFTVGATVVKSFAGDAVVGVEEKSSPSWLPARKCASSSRDVGRADVAR